MNGFRSEFENALPRVVPLSTFCKKLAEVNAHGADVYGLFSKLETFGCRMRIDRAA